MIVLDNGDKIRGDASVAAVVDYTLHGLAGSDLAQLADGQLADATGDLCTAGATVVVTAILFTNTHNAALTVNLFLLPSGGTARRILAKDLTLGIGFSLHYDGVKVLILTPSGGPVASYTNHASSHVDGNDDVQNATSGQKGLATAAQITKLDGIEAAAKDDQTGAEIKSAYEGEADTNAYTDAAVTNVAANTSAKHTQGTDTALGSGCVAADHGTAATDQVVNVCYGTGDPPAANTTTIGTLFVKYTA